MGKVMNPLELITLLCGALAAVGVLVLLILQLRKTDDGTKAEIEQIRRQLNDLQRQNADDFARNRRELADSLDGMRKKIEELTKASFEQRITLNETVTKAMQDIRDRTIEQNERQSKAVADAVGKMQESNEKKLEEMRVTVDEKLTSTLTARLGSSFKTVSEQLENLYKSLGEMKELSVGVTDNVGALNRVLTNVKARGTWAEVQLAGILDQTIPNMYDTNVATGEKSSERVEFAIRIPSGDDPQKIIYLPLDSKFPMEDYVRLCSAAERADAQAVAAARKELEARVYQQAKEIKKYINPPYTTPYAIMYLATEGLYAEIVSSRSGILEKIQNTCNVLVAGPSTVTALLNSLSMGFKTVAINEKANEVRLLLGAAKVQYEKFGVVLEQAKRKIDDAGKTLGEAQHRNAIIQKKLKNVEDVELPEADGILGLGGGLSDEG